MTTVAKIIEQKGSKVVSIGCDHTVLDAAKRMNENRVGAVVVTSGEKVVGIFTERDILCRIVAEQRDPASVPVKDVMTSPVTCCAPETTRDECRTVMRSRRIRHLPVVKDERLVGIISIGDLLLDLGAEQQATIHHLYEYMNLEWRQEEA